MGTLPSNSTFSASTYGGTTVLSSLAALKKPAKRVLTLLNVKSDKGYHPNLTVNEMERNKRGRYMMTPGWTEKDDDNGRAWNMKEDSQQIILTKEDRLSQQ